MALFSMALFSMALFSMALFSMALVEQLGDNNDNSGHGFL